MTATDIDVGEEAIRRLAGQVFNAPKDLTRAKETVSGDGSGKTKKRQEQQGQNKKDAEKQKEKKPMCAQKYHDGNLLAEAILIGRNSRRGRCGGCGTCRARQAPSGAFC